MKLDIKSKIAKLELPLHVLNKWLPESEFIGKVPKKNILIKEMTIDSRAICKNSLFFSIKGKNYDGHSFLEEVKKKHAIAAIVDKKIVTESLVRMVDQSFFLLSVDDVLEAFGKIASEIRKSWHGKLISVTGSNGKTTAKELIANILKKEVGEKSRFFSYGNQNNHIGVPLNLMRLASENKFAVIEMGMNQVGEISKLSSMVKPNFSLIVNAQREHQEFLGSVRTTAYENGEVISHLTKNNIVVFPKDKENEDIWWKLAKKNMCKVFRFGLKNDYSNFDSEKKFREITCEILTNNPLFIRLEIDNENIGSVRLNGLGEHFARTATGAVATCIALGISYESVIEGLKTFMPIKGRGNFHYLNNGSIVVDDSYNANPDSVHAAIKTMLNVSGRKAMILGDMAELGKDSTFFHQEILSFAVEHLDEVFLFGRQFSEASKNLKFGRSYSSIKQLEEEVRVWLNSYPAKKNSTLLWVKGSRASNLDVIVNCLVSREGF